MKIERIDPFLRPDVVAAVTAAYQQIFGNEPWNEGYNCPVCKLTVSLQEKSPHCPKCESLGKLVLMTEYWPKSKIITDFYQEMLKPNSLFLVAIKEEKIIGFTWGYQMSINQETDLDLEAPGLHNLISGNFFYLDEVAVLPEFQGKGIGKKLIKQLFENQPYRRILLRTLDNSQMSNLVNRLNGKTILPISRDRIIMSLAL